MQRVKPDHGRAPKRFRWWHLFCWVLLYLRPTHGDGRQAVCAVDQSSGEVKAHLYLDGRQHAQSKLPDVCPVPGAPSK
ncbi:hypothetical protein [Streptomyces phaeochromogenes]|uniref:hypothetical protein n=1 Tax=Streptomyces phaeochromogenes TaxID=1923 RepID=UPI00386C60A9|nr:hypothetical protein OHB08_04335 [Streptomyces phaeochromogenes]